MKDERLVVGLAWACRRYAVYVLDGLGGRRRRAPITYRELVGTTGRSRVLCEVPLACQCQSGPSASLAVRNRKAFGQYLRIALQSISHQSSVV
jgi:hypothetical protein